MRKYSLLLLLILCSSTAFGYEIVLINHLNINYSCIISISKELLPIPLGYPGSPKLIDGLEVYFDSIYTYYVQECGGVYQMSSVIPIKGVCACPKNYSLKIISTSDGVSIHEFVNNYPYYIQNYLISTRLYLESSYSFLFFNTTLYKFSDSNINSFVYAPNLSDINDMNVYDRIYVVTCSNKLSDSDCVNYLSTDLGGVMYLMDNNDTYLVNARIGETLPVNLNIYELDSVIINEPSVIINEFINLSFLIPFSPLILITALILLIALIKPKEPFVPWKLHIKTFVAINLALNFLVYFYLGVFIINPIISLILLLLPLGILISKTKGLKLNETNAPGLFNLLRKLSKEMGVKIPNKVLLVPGTTIGVSGFFNKNLMIGMAGIRFLNAGELYSILAHEFGHLKGFDTVIGGALMSIKLGLNKTNEFLTALSRVSALIFLVNLALFIYNRIYTIFILYYSRCREYMADLSAASVVGRTNYAKSFNNYVTYSLLFDNAMPRVMVKLAMQKKLFRNVYKFFDKTVKNTNEAQLKKFTKKSLKVKVSRLFSTHPKIDDRIKNLKNVNDFKRQLPSQKALSLIRNSTSKEEQLTKLLNERFFKIKLTNLT